MDIALIETGNGGDIQIVNGDIALVFGLENNPYLAMYGGNVAQNTVDTEANEVAAGTTADWWGNNLCIGPDETQQFNSDTERTMNATALTSAGRISIQNAIQDDLDYLEAITGYPVTVSVNITSPDRIEAELSFTLPDGTTTVTIVVFKQAENGDFYIFDFNDDFFVGF